MNDEFCALSVTEKIKERWNEINRDINSAAEGRAVEIIAVSKNRNIEMLKCAYDAGIRHYGENKAQEARDKGEFFKNRGIRLSFIGRIQKNKIKYIAGKCFLIQSVDSYEIASAIDAALKKEGIEADVLIQVNSSYEKEKAGFYPEDALKEWKKIKMMKNIHLKGVMTIGAHTEDEKIIEKSFAAAYEAYSEIEREFPECEILSMGMSDDYKLALKNHSNMLRLGRVLFDGLN